MGYIIGSDPGAFHIAQQIGGPDQAMRLAGLYRKAMTVIMHGVNFVQMPLEGISEFQEPDLKENMEKVKKMGITFGIHGETAALGGEGIQMDSALKDTYVRVHQKIETMLTESGKLGSKYLLLHSSESLGFLQLGREFQQTTIVDFWGRPINVLLNNKTETGEKLVDWAIRKKFIMEIVGMRGEADYKQVLEREKEAAIERLTDAKKNQRRTSENPNPTLTEEEEEGIKKDVEKDIPPRIEKSFKDTLRGFSQTLNLTYATERLAYYIVARWMEITNDPLWEKIINSGIEYYATLAKKTKEEWLEENKIEKLSMDNEHFISKYTLWFPAVSAKYIWGHFSQEKNPNKDDDPRIHELTNILEKYNMPFVIESPMVPEEEMSRLPNPLQMYHVMKTLDEGRGVFGVALDIEHILMANINPEVAFDLLPEDGGDYMLVIHTGWPSPLGPAHIPIPLGSEQQLYLYKMYYKLRKKGMGIDKNCYIIFERGGGDDPYKQSYLALRNIVHYLEKDVPPDQLPTEFYGISTQQLLSVEKQKVAIKEHAYDPLKGMITVPEEEHGMLGKAALEKGKRPEEWAKEKYK